MSEGVWIVKIPGCKSFFRAGSLDTVAEMKAKTQGEFGIPSEQQCLIFEGTALSDSETLAACGIATAKKPTLHLLVRGVSNTWPPMTRLASSFRGVRVSIIGGEGFDMEARQSDTVGSIKEKLRDRLGAPVNEQRVIFSGVELDDNHTLSSQDVSTLAGSTLYVLIRRPPKWKDNSLSVHVGTMGTSRRMSLLTSAGSQLRSKHDGFFFVVPCRQRRMRWRACTHSWDSP
mmetsp:Transcript_90887/g.252880  ORF Transcript_90887/g.252880 Transcript_90887/m.252880 type:complete len:230 (-) Transcript_90887:67-756(-)